jgi:hypothetical protein
MEIGGGDLGCPKRTDRAKNSLKLPMFRRKRRGSAEIMLTRRDSDAQ